MTLPKVVTVQNMRESDAATIAKSVTSAQLMYRAALGIYNAVRFVGKVAIVCGSGNNGGDGYALACILLDNGITPTIFRVNEKFSKDGLFYYQTAVSKGAEEGNLSVPAPFSGYDIVVDCLLGTGFSGEVRGEMQAAIELINGCTAYVISADINSGVNGDTMRLAGLMLDQGVDTETLYANLYLNDYEVLKFKAHVYECMRRSENGVAWVRVGRDMQQRFGLDLEAASNAISYMENIRECLCWLAFIDGEKPEDGIRVRLRSRFMTINHVAERHHGGGHACAAGATVYSEEEMEQLIREADHAAKTYKETHEGWM